jgi:hypothetical protein
MYVDNFKILLIEDDEAYAFLFSSVIEIKFGKTCVLTLVSSKSEMDVVYSTGMVFDSIVCDGIVPGWDSHRDYVRGLYPNTRLVTHTSSVNVPIDLTDGHLVFSKCSDGRGLLVQWIGERIRDTQEAR